MNKQNKLKFSLAVFLIALISLFGTLFPNNFNAIDSNHSKSMDNVIYSVNGKEHQANYGQTIKLSAPQEENKNFLFWLENGKLISKSANYNVTIYSEQEFVSIYKDSDSKVLIFLDANNDFLKIIDSKDLNTENYPSVSKKPGYEFNGWDLVEEINEDTYLYASYTQKADYSLISTSAATLSYILEDDRVALISKATSDNEIIEFGILTSLIGDPSENLDSQQIRATIANDLKEYAILLDLPQGMTIYARSYFVVNSAGTYLTEYSDLATISNKNEVLVTFETNGGSPIEEVILDKGSRLEEPQEPTKAGYTFLGWFLDKATTEVFDFNTLINNDLKLYALWEKESYEISFDSRGGDFIQSQIIEYGDVLIRPDNPTKAGYSFENWYLDANLEVPYDFEALIVQDLTLYAKWEVNNYHFDYELNGGTWGWDVNPVTNPSNGIFAYSKLPEIFMKDFYIYLRDNNLLNSSLIANSLQVDNWTDFSKPSNDPYAHYNHTTTNNATSIDGYSQFFLESGSGNEDTGEILELIGGFLGAPGYKEKYATLAQHLAYLVNDRYQSNLWKNNAARSLAGFTLDGYFYGTQGLSTSSPKFKALRGVIPTPTKGYNYLNGSLVYYENDFLNTSVAYDQEVTLSIPNKEGYFFSGWYDNPNFNGDKITKININEIPETKYYAKWESITPEYIVNFVVDGGSEVETQLVQADNKVIEPLNPTKPNHNFLGWYLDEARTIIYNFDSLVTSNITLFALWEYIIPEYLISFNVDGGTEIIPIRVKEGQIVTKPVEPIKAGYKFLGWYLDEARTTLYDFETLVTKDFVLYAKWEEVNFYTINFEVGGGDEIAALVLEEGKTVPRPVEPTKAGYNFLGWYLDQARTILYDFETLVTKDLTLYAKWEENQNTEYTITYILDGGEWAIVDGKEGLKISFLTDFYDYINPSEDLNTFMHGLGKSAGYAGTWTNEENLNKLYSINQKTANNSLPYFINQLQYNSKWLAFFDMLDEMVRETNPDQSFWGSPYVGFIRIKEYFSGARYGDDERLPEGYIASSDLKLSYTSDDPTIYLLTPTKGEYTFLGWYTNSNLTGERVYTIPTGSAGHKVFYAKWQNRPYQQSEYEYWVERLSGSYNPAEIIYNQSQINAYNNVILSDYSKTKVLDLLSQPSTITKTALQNMINSYSNMYSYTVYNNHTGNSITGNDKTTILNNRNLNAIASTVNVRYGIITNFTAMRAYPTLYYANSSSIDRFQETGLNVSDGVLIYHTSSDGLWHFVQAQNYFGWVQAKDIALCSFTTMANFLNSEDFVLITADRININGVEVRMGRKIPYTSETETSYLVQFPTRDSSGNLVLEEIHLDKDLDIHAGYLPYTTENVLKQVFKMLGIPYRWGDLAVDGRDCSSTMNDVYACFGFMMPRNTSNQNSIPNYSTKGSFTLNQIKSLRPGSLIFSSGHVMMYIGNDTAGNPWIIHTTTGGTGGCLIQTLASFGVNKIIATLKVYN